MSYKGSEKQLNIGEYLFDVKKQALAPSKHAIKLTADDVNTLIEKLNILKLHF